MTSERLLNMSIEVLYLPSPPKKNLYPPKQNKTNFWLCCWLIRDSRAMKSYCMRRRSSKSVMTRIDDFTLLVLRIGPTQLMSGRRSVVSPKTALHQRPSKNLRLDFIDSRRQRGGPQRFVENLTSELARPVAGRPDAKKRRAISDETNQLAPRRAIHTGGRRRVIAPVTVTSHYHCKPPVSQSVIRRRLASRYLSLPALRSVTVTRP